MSLDKEKISHIIQTISEGYLSYKYWKHELFLFPTNKASKKELQDLLQEVQKKLPLILQENRFKIHWQMACLETVLIAEIKKAS